jgi:hypothetical protein
VIIFYSAWFLPEKTAKPKKKDPKPNWNQPKPASFGLIFLSKKGQTYRLILIGFLMGF